MSNPTTTSTSSAKYGTVIKVCTCNSKYQDKRYGVGKGEKARCTICTKEK